MNLNNICEHLIILERDTDGEALSSELMGDLQQLRPCGNPFI